MKTSCLFLVLALAAIPGRSAGDRAAELDWLAGHWCGSAGTRQFEEMWLPPAGGQLIGVGRTVVEGRVVSFEFMRIGAVDGTLTFLAQPNGRSPTPFRLEASGDHWVRFENLEHDFPQQIEYRRDGNALIAEIAGPGGDGAEHRIAFAFSACGNG